MSHRLSIILLIGMLFILSACQPVETEIAEKSLPTVEEEGPKIKMPTDPADRDANQAQAEADAIENRAFFAEAQTSKDSDLCENLESSDAQFACEQSILFDAAIDSKSKAMCKNLELDKAQERCKDTINRL